MKNSIKKCRNNLFLGLAVVILISACTSPTYVRVRTPEPAKHNYGPNKQFVLAEMTGRRSMKEEVSVVLESQLRQTNWWQFTDISSQGVEIKLRGDNADVSKGKPSAGEVFFKVEIFDTEVDTETQTKETTVDGEKKTTSVKILNANSTIGVTSVDGEGRVILAEREFFGSSQINANEGDRQQVRLSSLQSAVGALINDITPRFITQRIKFDDEAEDLKSVADSVKNKAYTDAESQLQRMQKSYPNRADIIYNLAVITELMENHEEALSLYDKAISLGPKDFYHDSRSRLAGRMSSLNALQ